MQGASLTERRKAATRWDIARAAATLFVENGLRATRAEDIARAAGVAPRTLYRYCATKEEAVAPLFAVGARQWVEAVRDAPRALPLPDALRHAAARALAAAPGDTENKESLEWVRSLLRMAADSPALRSVWNDACRESESTLAAVLAARTGPPADAGALDIRLAAAVAGAAVRVAVETWAAGDAPAEGAEGPAALAEHCLTSMAGGLTRRP
ncbi:TetR/AcrR family transcriptional regulator [Streptomyces sp. NBC_00654]|uniref:TetR/AcrR family transcriptional regulator n=1 Tax=Streptomyces sp. NBC_00654 TaxID=2975799 RepID=UPI0022504F07|nr:TetR/AcrR family transcriptional regulator [Streptomyces sp. NBC_00654]MCX4965664.1 TetR/AcrR family transcriptional regulator [Streptomyces sp. NBC_00654]